MPRPRILVVDDDPGIVRLLEATLRGERNFEVLEARTGEEAVAIARRERPDLVILDVLLPGLDGFAVCRTMKEDLQMQDSRVLLVTALGQSEDNRVAAAAAGADAYLSKPFMPLMLLDTVRRLLG